MRFWGKFFSFACALVVSLPLWAQHFPSLTGHVVDEAGLLTEEERYEITLRLQELAPAQVVVATVPSMDGYDIDFYTNKLFRFWQLGDKNRNDGVLILLALQERALRIEVGYGLEGTLTDAICGQIIYKKMIPLATQNQFGPALVAGSKAVADILSGYPTEFSPKTRQLNTVNAILFFLCFFSPFIICILKMLPFIRNNSPLNRLIFGIFVIETAFVYTPFLTDILASMVKAPTHIATWLIPFLFILLNYYLMFGCWILSAWKKDPLFPLNEIYGNIYERPHRRYGAIGGLSSFGGGGFHGGGGSSGGGGASGHF